VTKIENVKNVFYINDQYMVTWAHERQPLPNGISIGSAVFAQHIRVTNTQTDTQTTLRAKSVAIGRISFSCSTCDAV